MRMLIAYDGTAAARAALKAAAQLLNPTSVVLLTVWESMASQTTKALSRAGLHQTPTGTEQDGVDPAYEAALELCDDGIAVAQSLGLSAQAHLMETSTTTSAAIVETAKELGADVIVSGTRGLSGPKSWFNTSTAAGILRAAQIPVLVVPPADNEA